MFPVAMMIVLFAMKVVDAPLSAWFMASFLALGITGLLSFVYVTCVFGPYETSVRTRLIREMAKGSLDGISHQELLQGYNVQKIVNIRLRRLMGSGDIIEQGGHYRAGNTRNVFFIFDAIAVVIKKWIG